MAAALTELKNTHHVLNESLQLFLRVMKLVERQRHPAMTWLSGVTAAPILGNNAFPPLGAFCLISLQTRLTTL